MGERLTQLISQLNSSVFVLLLALIIIAVGLFKLGRLTEKFTHHEKRLDKADETHDLLVKVSEKLDLVYEFTNPRSLAKSLSPMALTDLGKGISDKINAPLVFKKYEGKLLADLTYVCPSGTSAYDIQESAFKICRDVFPKLLTGNEINAFKQVAFNEGIQLDDMWIIFGILLRDACLKDRGIPIFDVDESSSTH